MRYVFTPQGMARLRDPIERTRAEYKAVCDDNPAALESGDTSGWHDNFAYEENMRKMHMLAARVRELERIYEQAEQVPVPREAPGQVVLGASVRFRIEGDADVMSVWIAGYDDGNPEEGRLSYNSPLGRALLGAEPGEARPVVLGGEERWVEVIALGPAPDGAA